MADPAWARVVVYRASEAAAQAALEDARNADVLVKASGVGVFDGLLEAGILEVRRPGSLAVFWDVDAPATLGRITAHPDDAFVRLIPRYDIVFTYGGGPHAVEGYVRFGARRCIPIYNALDPLTHYPVAPDPGYAADLLFIGHRLPDRRERIGEFFLKAAAALPDRRFLLGGNGWEQETLPPYVQPLGHVFTHQLNLLNCSARCVLNVNRDSMAAYGWSPPTRLFEAAGVGACLITDKWAGIDEFLLPGEEVLVASDGDEVAEFVAGVSWERARTIGAAARRRLLAEHTYERRAAAVEDALDRVIVECAA
jgi:spore maturation protein CgeB